MNLGKTGLLFFIALFAGPSSRAATIQYDFTGLFSQSSFQSVVKVGDTFTASLQIDYSAPLIAVNDNGGLTFAWFHQAIRSFSMTFNGISLAIAWPDDATVVWDTDDRVMLGGRSFGYHHNLWVEGGSLFDTVLFIYPNAGAAIPASFDEYGDLVPIAAPSAFSFSLGSYVVETNTMLSALGVVTAGTMRDINSPASVPEYTTTGTLFAGLLLGMFVIKTTGRVRRNISAKYAIY